MNPIVSMIIVLVYIIVLLVVGYFGYQQVMNKIHPTSPPNCNILGCDPTGLCIKPSCIEYHLATIVDANNMFFTLGDTIALRADNTFVVSNFADGNGQSVFLLNNSQSTIIGFTCNFPQDDNNILLGFVANSTGTVISPFRGGKSDSSNNLTVSGIAVAPGKGILFLAGLVDQNYTSFQMTITTLSIAPPIPTSPPTKPN